MLRGILPIDRSRAPADVLAGVTLAALAIPEVMGYAKIAGTPVITGLYTILIPTVLYALFGASRHLVVGADSATAAILAAGLAGIAVPGSPEWLALSGAMAILAAGFLLLARFARLGFLADFLSRTVLVGFLTGVGIQVAAGEIAGMLGLAAARQETIRTIVDDVRRLQDANPASLALSGAVLATILVARKLSPKVPGALIAVVGSIVASKALDLQQYGAAVIGAVPRGLPALTFPAMAWQWEVIHRLMPTVFAMFVVILAQSAATARAYATRHNERFDENSDLVGLTLANVGACLSGTFVVNGSPTKTQMVESAGGHSQLAHLTAAGMVLLVLLFLTAPLAYLPQSVLSAIVFLIGVELIDVKGMAKIYAERPWEFWVALLTAAAVVSLGVYQSILLAIVMSLAVHTRHGYLMNNMLLVTDHGKGWRQQKVETRAQIAPGLMIYRFMHNMYYANAQVITDEAMQLARNATPPLSWFCIDAAAVNDVDFTAAEALRTLHAHLAEEKIRLVFCEVVDHVRDELDRSHVTDLVGPDAFFSSPAAVVAAYEGQRAA